MFNKENINIEPIIYSRYLRYVELDELVKGLYSNSSANRIAIFIDVFDILYKAYYLCPHTNASIESITPAVLNMVSHYRKYFLTQYDVYPEIIFVYSVPSSGNITRYYPNYNSKAINIMISNHLLNEKIDSSISFMKEMCNYLNNVYFLTGHVEPSVIMHEWIKDKKYDLSIPCLVISSSPYTHLLVASNNGLVSCMSIKSSKNDKRNINAYSYNTVLGSYLWDTRGRNYDIYKTKLRPFHMLPLIVLSGLPKRGIPAIKNITMAMKLVETIDYNMLNDFDYMYRIISDNCERCGTDFVSLDEFTNRCKALSIEFQGNLYRASADYIQNNSNMELSSPDEIKLINNKYFINNPINLEYI